MDFFNDHELWWVAVEGASDKSGGWFILADPLDAGAAQIDKAFIQADILIMAAVDLASLADIDAAQYGAGSTVWHSENGRLHSYSTSMRLHEALVDLRLSNDSTQIILASDNQYVGDLLKQMKTMTQDQDLSLIRMDLRKAPRGRGAWGLAKARSKASSCRVVNPLAS